MALSTLEDHTLVLIGFGESLAAIHAAWDLIDSGFQVHLFCRVGASPPLARDRRVICHWVTAPEVDALGSISQVMEIIDRLGRPAVLPLDDVAVWLTNEVARKDQDVIVAGPTGRLAALSLDKSLQLALASLAGMMVPRTAIFKPGSDTAESFVMDKSIGPPWIVKPAMALDLQDGRIIKGETVFVTSRTELLETLSKRRHVTLVQSVLRGVGHGVFGQARLGKVTNWSAHERIRMMNPSGSGSSAARSIDPDADLVHRCADFVTEAEWTGLFMLEFLKDREGRFWFMELNGRTWGSLVLASRRNLPYPVWTVATAIDPTVQIAEVAPGPHLVARHIGREILHLGFVLRGRIRLRKSRSPERDDPSLAAYPKFTTSIVRVLRWHSGDRPYNYRHGHLAVLLSDTLQTVSVALRVTRSGR